jgi:hypothetical protein
VGSHMALARRESREGYIFTDATSALLPIATPDYAIGGGARLPVEQHRESLSTL